jgi:hypothetical protein
MHASLARGTFTEHDCKHIEARESHFCCMLSDTRVYGNTHENEHVRRRKGFIDPAELESKEVQPLVSEKHMQR